MLCSHARYSTVASNSHLLTCLLRTRSATPGRHDTACESFHLLDMASRHDAVLDVISGFFVR